MARERNSIHTIALRRRVDLAVLTGRITFCFTVARTLPYAIFRYWKAPTIASV